MSPDVSVLIASHRPGLLPFALESAWEQEGVSLQVLVNFSRDPENFRTAWNDLAAIARGRYFCILGDDDTLGAAYLAETVKTLDETGADIAYSDVRGAYRGPDGSVWIRPRGCWPARGTFRWPARPIRFPPHP